MANPEHVEVVKQGAKAIAEWRGANPNVRLSLRGAHLQAAGLFGADLREADLTSANLFRAVLSATDLSDVNLREASLVNADLSGANLRGANLTAADLHGARLTSALLIESNLTGTDLRDADLANADLRGARLERTMLRGAKLHSARVVWTKFMNVDLSEVRGLDSLLHFGPSNVAVDTLRESHGRLPDVFLRDCGLLPWEIAMAKLYSLDVSGTKVDEIAYKIADLRRGEPLPYCSAFISYSHKDEKFAKRLHSRMRDEKLRVWYAPEDMKGGRKIHEQIDEAIRVHDKLLLVLSDQSMGSEWVKTEIRRARKRELREGRRVLFPIRLVPFEAIRDWEAFDADTGKDMGVELREYFIPDFSDWKDHDAFEAAFKRLLNDLKAESDREAEVGAPEKP